MNVYHATIAATARQALLLQPGQRLNVFGAGDEAGVERVELDLRGAIVELRCQLEARACPMTYPRSGEFVYTIVRPKGAPPVLVIARERR